MHIEKRPCEDMVKELLSASQEDRPHQKATPYLTLGLGGSGFVRNYAVYATQFVVFC